MERGDGMEDLQNLLEKINRDGVEKAEAEAKRIVAEAEAKAAAIVREAEERAARDQAVAAAEAEASARRAAETIRQTARDVVIGVKDAVTALLEKLLTKEIDRALADEKAMSGVVTEAIAQLAGPGEIVCGPRLAKALVAQLSGKKAFTVTTDEAAEAGFSVRLEGGRVEHAFTCDVISSELAKRMRPELAALLR